MNNLGLLIKTNIVNDFNLNGLKNLDPKKKQRFILSSLAIVVASIYIIGILYIMCNSVSDLLIQNNMLDMMITMGFIGTTLLCLFTTLYKSSGYLFSSKDFDMLISLPIKESEIVASKIFSLLISNYIFSAPIIFITGIVYGNEMNEGIIFYVLLFIMFLFVPLIPVVIASILSFLITKLSIKTRYKNLSLIIGSIFLIIGYILFVSNIKDVGIAILQNKSSINNLIDKIYFPARYYVDGLVNKQPLDIIKFVSISTVIFISSILLFSKQFKLVNSQMNETYKAKSYKRKDLKSTDIISTLLEKEIRKYFSSYMYVLNSSMGMILLLIFALGITVFGADKIATIIDLNIDLKFIGVQILMITSFCIITSCTTYCSISLEGKNLWILKTLPIDIEDIFKSKVILNLIINIPISIISFLMLSIRLKFDIKFILIGLIYIISLCFMIPILGLLLNLLFPNLEWKNEVKVIKQSISIMLVMLISFAYLGLAGFIYYKTDLISENYFILSLGMLNILISYILWKNIKKEGINLFKQIS